MVKKIPTWAFFCVNDESPIDVKVPSVMCCILCYSTLVGLIILGKKKGRGKKMFHISIIMG
jgi:hypothetical protein